MNVPSGASSVLVQTTHWTVAPGSGATLTFQGRLSSLLLRLPTYYSIPGCRIAVHAVYPFLVDLPQAQVKFVVDSSTPTIATYNSTVATALSTQVIYTSPDLADGSHTLTLVLLNSGNFTLNFLEVSGGSKSSGSANNEDQGASSSSTSSSSLSTGKIIGIVLGGISFILLLCVLASILWRRKYFNREAQTSFKSSRKLSLNVELIT